MRKAMRKALSWSTFTWVLVGGALEAQQTIELPRADRTLELHLQPVYQAGRLDGEAWEEFQSLDGAAFDADGRLYLVDDGAATVLAVDAQGRFLHRVGSVGDGPGEYRSPSGVLALPDGRVAVWDFRKRAFLLYDAEGTHLDEVRPDLSAGVPGIRSP